MRSIIMSTAWDFFKDNLFASFGEALKASWDKYKVKKALKAGIVKIVFFSKSSGCDKEVEATLNPEIMPNYEKKTDRVCTKNDVVTFWSLTDNSFKRYRVERFISFAA